jgi:hypothetical protein
MDSLTSALDGGEWWSYLKDKINELETNNRNKNI